MLADAREMKLNCIRSLPDGSCFVCHDEMMSKLYGRLNVRAMTPFQRHIKYKSRCDPPSGSAKDPDALSVTHHHQSCQIGRDVFVQVNFKGFLFPLGHPAILTKATERWFSMEKDTDGVMRSVARLIQRFYIRVPEFTRSFPALGQPNKNRCWGHGSIVIKGFTTPDLAAPSETCVGSLGQSAFWPMTLCGRDVVFSFGDADTQSNYGAPQIFVDNNVVQQSSLLREVIAEWRACVASHLCKSVAQWSGRSERGFAKVTSGRLRYVQGMHGDNTDIETDQVLLDVQIASDDGYPTEIWPAAVPQISAQMEEAEQPPFYPVRRRSRIGLTHVSTIADNTTSRFLLEFDGQYLKHGFSPDRNPNQIFGRFVDIAPMLDLSDNPSYPRGLTNSRTWIVCLSARRGLVGGYQSELVQLAN
jgi:hypothetical protein